MQIGVNLIPLRPREVDGALRRMAVAESHLTRRLFRQILGRIEGVRGTPRNQEPHGVKAMMSAWRSGSGVSERDGRTAGFGNFVAHYPELRR